MDKTKLTDYLQQAVKAVPAVLPYLSLEAITFLHLRETKQGSGELTAINRFYHDAITQALTAYFEQGGNMSPFKNAFKRGTLTAFNDAFDLGWMHGGASLPLTEEALAWLEARVNQEFGYVDMLFAEAKQLRKEESDFFAWATEKADGYTNALKGVYNVGKLMAKPNQLLTWKYGETEHCDTCERLNGQRHKAAWYIARNYIPGKPGAAMECGGYRCQCGLYDANGLEVTI